MFLAVAMIATVVIISYGYSRIIEQFPSGGGGYVLTITISIAAGADGIFSFLPKHWSHIELGCSIAGVSLLTLMNLRGIKESVTSIAPMFAVFLVTHAILLLASGGCNRRVYR